MANEAHRMGDCNDGDGCITSIPQKSVFVNSKLGSVDGSIGTKHDDDTQHDEGVWKTAQGCETVHYENINANHKGNTDTCDHKRATGSPNVFLCDFWPLAPGLPGRDVPDPNFPIPKGASEIPDENVEPGVPQEGECASGGLARAGNQSGEQQGDIPDPNKIKNVQIPVKCDGTVQTTMVLNEPTPESPAPASITWEQMGLPSGVTLNPTTGEVAGTAPRGVYDVTVTAKNSANIIDSKTYKVVSEDCTDAIRFTHPLPGSRVTSPVSMSRRHPVTGQIRPHRGTDNAYRDRHLGQVLAAASGIVVFAGTKSGYGNVIIIGHPNSKGKQMACTLYAHLSSIGVSPGQQVSGGDAIGVEGNTGIGTGAHLHFEIRGPNYITSGDSLLNQKAQVYDPQAYINGPVFSDTGIVGETLASGKPYDPGKPSDKYTVVTNDAELALKPMEVDVVCNNQKTLPVTPGTPSDPTAGQTGPVNCGMPPLTKEQVIACINMRMDMHPELDAEDRNFILTTARIESGFNPCAKNPNSSATGLYQFLTPLANAHGLTPADRVDCDKSTEAMVSFYNGEMKPYYNNWVASGMTTIAGKPVVQNAHTARYASLSKSAWLYGLIHHDGVGNAANGKDKGGIDYFNRTVGV